MTIEKGQDWGSRGPVPSNVPIVESDAGLADLFAVRSNVDGALAIDGPELVGLLRNDDPVSNPRESSTGLARTVGARATHGEIPGSERTILPIDLGIVSLNPGSTRESHVVMASSLVICSRFWSGVVEGAMNSAFLADWNVAPSGHPNDGRFDVVRAELKLGDRYKARKRLPSGAHLPHPGISVRRLKSAEFTPAPSARVWIDGRLHGDVALVSVTVVPDAVMVAI